MVAVCEMIFTGSAVEAIGGGEKLDVLVGAIGGAGGGVAEGDFEGVISGLGADVGA